MESMREAWTDERLDDLSDRMDRDFARVDVRFDKVDARFDRLEDRIERFEARMTTRFDWLMRLMLVGYVTALLAVLAA